MIKLNSLFGSTLFVSEDCDGEVAGIISSNVNHTTNNNSNSSTATPKIKLWDGEKMEPGLAKWSTNDQ